MNIPAELFRKLNEEVDIAPIILLDNTNCLANHALDIIINNEDMNTVLKMLKIKLIMIYKNKITPSDYDLTILLTKLQQEELTRVHDVMLYALLIQESTDILKQILAECIKSLSDEKYKQTTNFNLELLDVILETCTLTGNDIVKVDQNISKLLMNLLCNQEKQIQIKIVKDVIPKYIYCTKSNDILHLLWDDFRDNSFFYDCVLLVLEQYFIPNSTNALEFSVLDQTEFWTTLQNNITSEDPFVKKQNVYLLKKSVQSLFQNDIKSNLDSVEIIQWNVTHKYKNAWKNFFILCDMSNEKQLHLVEPSFKLYQTLEPLHNSWRKCITKLFITHPHSAIVRYTVSQILTAKWDCDLEILISGLNNNYLYDATQDSSIFNNLLAYISNLNRKEFERFTELLAKKQPSPIPFYYICKSLENLKISLFSLKVLIDLINSSEKVPHLYIRKAIQHSLFLLVNKIQLTDEDFQNEIIFNDLIKIIFLFVNIGYLKRQHRAWKQILGYFKRDTCTNKFENLFSNMWKGNFKFSPKEYGVWFVILRDLQHLEYNCSNILKQIQMSNDSSTKLAFLLIVCHVINMYNNCQVPEVIDFLKEHMSTLLHEILTICTEWRSQCCLEFVTNIELVIQNIYLHKYIRDSTCDLLLDFWNKLRDDGLYDWYIILGKKIIHIYDESIHMPRTEASQLIAIKENITEAKEKYLMDRIPNNNVKRQILLNYYCTMMRLSSKYVVETNIETSLNDFSDYYDKAGSEILLLVLHVLLEITEKLPRTLKKPPYMDKYLELICRCKRDIFNVRTSEIYRPAFTILVKIITHPRFRFTWSNLLNSVVDEVFDASQPVTALRYVILQHALRGNELIIKKEILAEALLYGPVLRKDQRIEFDTCAAISLEKYMRELDKDLVNPCEFDAKVRSQAVLVSLHVLKRSSDRYRIMERLYYIMKEQYEEFSGKRYFGNSQIHFLKLRVMQTFHLLVNDLFSDDMYVSKWLLECLVNEREQPSIKLLIQWAIIRIISRYTSPEMFINVYFMPALTESKGTSCTSLFPILYHVLRGADIEIHIVLDCMNHLLPYTMGQHFSIRYYAQETIKRIYEKYETNEDFKKIYSPIYETICAVIDQTSSDKSFDMELAYRELPFSLSTVYYDIPRLTNVTHTEWIPVDYFDPLGLMRGVRNTDKSLEQLHTLRRKPTIVSSITTDGSTNVQKKIDTFTLANLGILSEVPTSKANLIVVASLIDRAPNLGGLSRTCEVFGVRQYVLNNAQFVKNKEYQSLSMSSEKWVDALEVKVENLAVYLRDMKKKGYAIVGAEQTADSQSLESFQFEKSTVLLLGNEKEGISPNLIHLLDQCIEIPQFGQIRSLNVHVAGALFIWEYAKQHCQNN